MLRQLRQHLRALPSSAAACAGRAAWLAPPRVSLRAHCGWSNAQLKMHVGLRVPARADGAPCARLTVGNATRPWAHAQVIMFDDSFRHSVAHDCDEERVVFQLVFEHPDAAGKGKGGGDFY